MEKEVEVSRIRVESRTNNIRLFAAESSFELLDPPLNPKLLNALTTKLNYVKPTRIQWLSIPHILNGRDVLLKSDTGSGKTCAFLLPIVQRLQAATPRLTRADGCKAIIISPTRELAMQIDGVLKVLLSPFHFIVHVSLTLQKPERTLLLNPTCLTNRTDNYYGRRKEKVRKGTAAKRRIGRRGYPR